MSYHGTKQEISRRGDSLNARVELMLYCSVCAYYDFVQRNETTMWYCSHNQLKRLITKRVRRSMIVQIAKPIWLYLPFLMGGLDLFYSTICICVCFFIWKIRSLLGSSYRTSPILGSNVSNYLVSRKRNYE